MIYLVYNGAPKKPWSCLLEGGHLVAQAFCTGWVFWKPTCISVPTGVVVRGCVWLQWIFLKTLSIHLPIVWWVIYECTCPHHAECSAVFNQKWHDPCAPPSLFTWFYPEQLFFCSFLWMEKVLKGKRFANVEEVKQKMAEALKSITIKEFKNCFE